MDLYSSFMEVKMKSKKYFDSSVTRVVSQEIGFGGKYVHH